VVVLPTNASDCSKRLDSGALVTGKYSVSHVTVQLWDATKHAPHPAGVLYTTLESLDGHYDAGDG